MHQETNAPTPRDIRANARSSVEETLDISPATKAYLEDLIEKLTERLEKKLERSEEKVVELTRQLDRSRGQVRALQIEVDDLQQYTRRQSVRIEGITYQRGETEDDLFTKIKTSFSEVDITIEKNDLVRFHRSAKPKNNKNGTLCAQTIVKFARWNIRRQAHYANKKARQTKKSFRIHHDLTRRRYLLIDRARGEIDRRFAEHNNAREQDNNEHKDKVFAFVDINSNLLIRSGETTYPFNTDEELTSVLDEIEQGL